MKDEDKEPQKMILSETTIGPCRLIHGDCRAIIPTLQFDALISDPPYGIAFQYGAGGRGIVDARHSRTCKIIGDEKPFDASHLMAIALKDSKFGKNNPGSIPVAVMGANHYCSYIPAGGTWFTWDKSCGMGSAVSFADAEIGWCNRRSGRNIFRHFWMGALRSGRGNQGKQLRKHVSEKPVELMEYMMNLARVGIGKIVLDPYMGSASTGVACMLTGRQFIGIEIDEQIYQDACQRLHEEWAIISS